MTTLATWFEEYGYSSRVTCRKAQLELAYDDERIFSLENDLGLPAVPFPEKIPDRYIQFGIAEGNLLGAAAGFALRGKIPFVNTFAAFGTMRACEQLRLDLGYNATNVKVIGYYTGVSGGFAGPTHHCVEDIAITRAIPNLTVLSPADAYEAHRATVAAAAHDGPVFLRASRAATPAVYEDDYDFEIGKAVTLRDGEDVTIVATGCLIVAQALRAAELLAEDGVSCRVLNMHTLKPFDADTVLAAAQETDLLVTYEDHNVIGGLGSAVAGHVLAEHPAPVLRFGVPDRFCTKPAKYTDILHDYGLGPTHVHDGVLERLERT